jgi:phage N-6-adenine-methyltransferase
VKTTKQAEQPTGELKLSPYVVDLQRLKAAPAHKLEEVGDQWRTPDWLYWGIFAKFGPFVLDLFTDGDNSKCARYYTAESNALKQDWAKDLNGHKAFGNPPYSRASTDHEGFSQTGMKNIMAKTIEERDKGAASVFLIKSATSETWWPEGANAVYFIRGRISFDTPLWFVPASPKEKRTGAGFSGAIAIFDKNYSGKPMDYVSVTELKSLGEALMQAMDLHAKKAVQQAMQRFEAEDIYQENPIAKLQERVLQEKFGHKPEVQQEMQL